MGEQRVLEEMAQEVEHIKHQTDLYMLYGGMLDVVTGEVTPDPKDALKANIQPQDAMTHIFYAYRHALKFTALARLYDREGYSRQRNEVEFYKGIAQKVINDFEEPIFHWLKELPNSIEED